MKGSFCILAVLVATICVIDGSKMGKSEEDKKMFEECKSEMGSSNEKPEGPPNPDDSKFKCFHACLMKKSGELVNGKIVPEKMHEHLTKNEPKVDDSGKQKLTECITTANEQTDECEIAGSLFKCIMEKGVMPKPPKY